MQIIIVVIIPRGLLGVRVSPRIYRSYIKARIYGRSHDVLAQCFSTVIPRRFPSVQSDFSSNYKYRLNNKCSLNHGFFV